MTDKPRKPLTFSEAADCADEGHAIASGLRLDEVAAMLRGLAAGPDPDMDHRQWPHTPPNKPFTRKLSQC